MFDLSSALACRVESIKKGIQVRQATQCDKELMGNIDEEEETKIEKRMVLRCISAVIKSNLNQNIKLNLRSSGRITIPMNTSLYNKHLC